MFMTTSKKFRCRMSDDLLVLARRLIKNSGAQKPRQIYLKRAVSTAYYAVFHAMAKSNADMFLGVAKASRSETAWQQAYRAMDHGPAKKACQAAQNLNFPVGIKACAAAFATLQEKRHSCDYDPLHRLTRQDALDALAEATAAVKALKLATPKDRRAFAAQLLFKRR
jgi:hypothetical protein